HDGIVTLDPRVEKLQHDMYAILAKHGIKGDNNTADTWDAALITVAGLRKLGPDATAEQLRAWITGLADDTSIIVRYDPKGPDGPRWQWVTKIGGEPLKQ